MNANHLIFDTKNTYEELIQKYENMFIELSRQIAQLENDRQDIINKLKEMYIKYKQEVTNKSRDEIKPNEPKIDERNISDYNLSISI